MKSSLSANYTNTQDLESIVGTSGICLLQDAELFWQQQVKKAVSPDTKIDRTIYPNTQEELASIIAWTRHNRCAILPAGNGSKLDWGGLVKLDPPNPPYQGGLSDVSQPPNPPYQGGLSDVSQPPNPPYQGGISDVSEPPFLRGAGGIVIVSTSRINRLIEHAVGDLTVTAEAGMKFADLQKILAREGQFLPIDPSHPEQATLGGIIATADAGSLRHRYRGVRDLLLGISFVRSDGKIAKAGGRVVKNVAGYDLMKLFAGSYGTLGIISQVTFRVYPLPESSGTVLLAGETNALSQATQILLSSALTPTAVDLLSPRLAEKLGFGKQAGLAARFQGIAESVKQQSSRLLEVGEKLGLQGSNFGGSDENKLWQRLSEIIDNSASNSAITCKIGVRPSAAVAAISGELPVEDAVIHAGSGLGILRFESATAEMLLQARRGCEAKGGFLTVLTGPIDLKQKLDIWGYNGSAIDLMRKIKHQFDPDNILSPNRFVGGI